MAPTQGPQGLTDGAIQNMSYDSVDALNGSRGLTAFGSTLLTADRGDAVMSQVSIAEYPRPHGQSQSWMARNRTRLVGKDLPNSYGGYAGAFTYYDNMAAFHSNRTSKKRMLIGRGRRRSRRMDRTTQPMIGRVAHW